MKLYDINWKDDSLRTVRLIETSVCEGASVPTRLCRGEDGRRFRCLTNMYFDTPEQAYANHLRELKSGLKSQLLTVAQMKKDIAETRTRIQTLESRLLTPEKISK